MPNPSKQSTFILLTSALVFTLSGCGKEEGDTDGGSTGDNTTTSTTAGPTTDATNATNPTGSDSDSDSSTTDPTTDSSTNPFIEDPDMGTVGSCSVTMQDCPDGQKCMPYANDGGNSWNDAKCVDVASNPGQAGDDCTYEGNDDLSGLDNCDVGMLCWFLDMDGTGECLEMCAGEPATCSEGQTCDISNEGVLALCLQGCDPTAPVCDNPGDICFPGSEGGFICDFDASDDDGGYAGYPCEFINACKLGNFCEDAPAVPNCIGTIGCCAPYCSLNDDDPKQTCIDAYGAAMHDLGGGEIDCVPWYEEGNEIPGLEHVGACISPQ